MFEENLIRGEEAGEVTGMVANMLSTNSLGKRYRAFGEWGMAAGKVEILLVASGLDVDRSSEALLVDLFVSIKEGDMGGEMDQVNRTDRDY